MKKAKQQSLDLGGGGIIRVEKREKYLMVENKSVRDSRLSLAARGLHHVLLSYPNHWRVKAHHIMKQEGIGRDAFYSLMRELEKFRYLTRKRVQGHRGRITWESVIYETPQGQQLTDDEVRQLHGGRPKKKKGDRPSLPFTENPYLAAPDMAAPEADAPDTGSPLTAAPDTARPDTGEPHAKYIKELPSQESPIKESPTHPHTNEPGSARAEGVGVSAGRFSDEQYECYIAECIKRGEHVESRAGLLTYLRKGEMDARVGRVLDEIAQAASPSAKCDSSCPKCFGYGLEVVPGKGARPCTNMVKGTTG